MNYPDLIEAEVVYVTHPDLDGITSTAELKKLEQMIFQNGYGKDESVIIYAENHDLPDILPNISPEINRLYITDLAVTNKKYVSQELERIAKSNKPKKHYSHDKIFILTDKKIPPDIGEIDRVNVRSANRKGYANLSTSQIVYRHVHNKIGFRPDNSFDILANLGAAADGRLPEGIYDLILEEAIELDNAIRENKNDPLFLDEIVDELAKYGLIKDENNKEKIKTDSDAFKERIDDASEIIEKGNIYNEGGYFISIIDNGELPFGKAASSIRNEEEKTVIVIIKDNGYNRNRMLMRGGGKGSLEPVLDVLKKYDSKGGGHAGDEATGYFTFQKKYTDDITKETLGFCSNPHNPHVN